MFKLLHYTSAKNVDKIVESGRLLDNLGRIFKPVNVGEGELGRQCCYPSNTYSELEKKGSKCGEGCGVYFRVAKEGEKIPRPKRGKVLFIFNSELLKHHKWHINFCENNGLFIDDNVAAFGSGADDCPNSSSNIDDVENTEFDADDAEIIVYESVPLWEKCGFLEKIIDSKGADAVDGDGVSLMDGVRRRTRTPRTYSKKVRTRTRTRTKTRKARSYGGGK